MSPVSQSVVKSFAECGILLYTRDRIIRLCHVPDCCILVKKLDKIAVSPWAPSAVTALPTALVASGTVVRTAHGAVNVGSLTVSTLESRLVRSFDSERHEVKMFKSLHDMVLHVTRTVELHHLLSPFTTRHFL